MQTALRTTALALPASLTRRPLRFRVATWLRLGWARRRERQYLVEMDHRMLRDIGLTRHDARAEARKHWWEV
ncbi:DUF1127 domain-containing protein [Belnapia sp. T6]|uniref:DUF1127 domain-containing protein n=1 Tax=Belnapia mucosa TaxID=2804532 RepID=A0ABS1UXB8_9PROT|nr:DUF1127 domain-containing protein [Belnapia mucosa]MBL6454106.1 DUF1127 domain-containing protein [Belnapia mucosa]